MAIGKFKDSELAEVYGIIAPNIVGTLLAGENLVIDSAKPDGALSSFRVDANGARAVLFEISEWGFALNVVNFYL